MTAALKSEGFGVTQSDGTFDRPYAFGGMKRRFVAVLSCNGLEVARTAITELTKSSDGTTFDFGTIIVARP